MAELSPKSGHSASRGVIHWPLREAGAIGSCPAVMNAIIDALRRSQRIAHLDMPAQSFAQVNAAERWGLDVIWIAELHFLPERSVASAPLLIASAIASQTRRMKIGAGAAAVSSIALGRGSRNA